jgi:hypothetical protein
MIVESNLAATLPACLQNRKRCTHEIDGTQFSTSATKVRNVEHDVLLYNELRGSSPQANYTDRATAACQKS